MSARSFEGHWAVILGGSSGFGLATAQKLAAHGMNLCLVHRDRRATRRAVEPEFEKLRSQGIELLTFNADALSPEKRCAILDELEGKPGKVRVLLHSIAFGNLKLIAAERARHDAPDSRAAAITRARSSSATRQRAASWTATHSISVGSASTPAATESWRWIAPR